MRSGVKKCGRNRMPIHHEFKKGKRVLVILHDGTRIVGKATGICKRNSLDLEEGEIPYKKIRAVTIYKPKE